ncbi:MAG: SHOCT domain-containing protein [Candidatus Limimorpha sp.]
MRTLLKWMLYIPLLALFTSCATIFGGARYNARVQVPNHPEAVIEYQGVPMGKGNAFFKIKRKDANKVHFIVKEEGCEPETFSFHGRKFRTGNFIGTLFLTDVVLFYSLDEYGNRDHVSFAVPLPIGLIVDACTAAWWKPDEMEKGITRLDYDNFLYTLEYKAKPIVKDEQPNTRTKEVRLRELKQLLDDGILTQEEYDQEKKKILDQ